MVYNGVWMNAALQKYLLLIGRIFLVAIFIKSGVGKIFNFAGTQQFMAAAGMPATEFFLAGAIVLELVGTASLLLGYWTRVGAACLLVFMVPATLIFHTDFANPMEMGQFLKNLAMMGGLLYVLAFGPGAVSLDARST